MGTIKNPSYRQRVGYQAALLGGFSTLATVLLVIGNLVTRDVIADKQAEDLLISLNEVVPAEYYDNDLLTHPLSIKGPGNIPVTVYRGTRGMKVTALAWQITAQGYAGEIHLLIGLDAGGTILGVRVLSHQETPGLGDRIEVKKDDWILGFNGLSLGNPPVEQWKVKKDGGRFDAFSGATITPRGVVKAITEGLQFFQAHRTELLNPPVIHSDNTVME